MYIPNINSCTNTESVNTQNFNTVDFSTKELKSHLKYKIPQIKLAILREAPSHRLPVISTPFDLEEYLEPMKHLSEENFVALHLNPRHQIIGFQLVSHGTISMSLVHPREVFKAALLSNAHALIVAHNHPTGLSQPSQDDKNTTRQLVQAGEIIGISILDHVIVTYNDIYSIRESNPDLFPSTQP